MSKQLDLTHLFSSNKRIRTNSPAVAQEECAESSLLPITSLYESSIVSTSETGSTSVVKKLKQIDHENLVSTEIQAYNKNDIGLFVNKDNLSTVEMYSLLTEPWAPSSKYQFPQVNVHRKMRSVCRHSWLSTYPWPSYSLILHGVLCRYCVLFKRKWSAYDTAKNPLGQLVLKPLTSLNNAHHSIQTHETTDYHLFSKEQAENFIVNYVNLSKSIDHILDNENQQQEAINRKVLSSIIKCILFIGKQNLAFRGHDDDGISHTPISNLGNRILHSSRCNI